MQIQAPDVNVQKERLSNTNVSSHGDHFLLHLQPALWQEGHEDPHGWLGRRRYDRDVIPSSDDYQMIV